MLQFLRHGSRTPELKHSYPNDIYQLEDFQPMGWGQLTNVSTYYITTYIYTKL